MMGRECFIYTYNHETSRTDIPMQEQGKSVEKAVVSVMMFGSEVVLLYYRV